MLCPWNLQVRTLKWVAISSSRGSSWPRDWTQVSCTSGRFFTREARSQGLNSLSPSSPWLFSSITIFPFRHSPKGHSSCNTLHLLKLLVDLSISPTGPENPSDEGPHQIQVHRQPGGSHKWVMQFIYGARMVFILVWARKLGVSGSVMNGGGDLPHLKG